MSVVLQHIRCLEHNHSLSFCQLTPKTVTVWREILAGGNVGEFGESSVICQIKPSKLVLINNLLADLLIRQTFFCQMLETSQFANVSLHQSFPPYDMLLALTTPSRSVDLSRLDKLYMRS